MPNLEFILKKYELTQGNQFKIISAIQNVIRIKMDTAIASKKFMRPQFMFYGYAIAVCHCWYPINFTLNVSAVKH